MSDSPWIQIDPTDIPEGLVAIRMIKYVNSTKIYPAEWISRGNPNLFYGEIVEISNGYKYWRIPMICEEYRSPGASYSLDMFERIENV
jgi:hypothetical protein